MAPLGTINIPLIPRAIAAGDLLHHDLLWIFQDTEETRQADGSLDEEQVHGQDCEPSQLCQLASCIGNDLQMRTPLRKRFATITGATQSGEWATGTTVGGRAAFHSHDPSSERTGSYAR